MEVKPKIKVKFTARMSIRNPDGTTREATLRGEKLVTEEEAKRYGYNPKRSGGRSRD